MRTLLIVAALWVVSATGTISQDPLPVDLEERAQVKAVVDWPFTVAKEEECLDLQKDQIEVLEDGRRLETIGLGRTRGTTIHVILIDTSRSMAGDRGLAKRRLRQTKRAAKYYLDLLARGGETHRQDEVMILTFDDDLLLRSPRTPISEMGGAERLKRAIDGIDGGYDTAFLDALHKLVYYLTSYSERHVLIILSDGADNVSTMAEHRVRRLIAEMNNLTIFAIGLGLPSGPHEDLLEHLAKVSGGRYFRVRAYRNQDYFGAALKKRFEDMQELLARQHHVSYLAPSVPTGGDEVEESGDVFREVRIVSSNKRCKVTDYKPHRFVHGTRSDRWKLVPEGKHLDSGEAAAGNRLKLVVRDIVSDSGPLASRKGLPPHGRRVEERVVEIIVPPLAEPVDPLELSAASMVEHLTDPARSSPGGHQINGKVFPYNRGNLAQEIFEASPGHRQWLRARMEDPVREEYLAILPPGTSERQLEAIVKARLERPRIVDLQKYLAAWLGDVPVRELGFRLEREWANLSLAVERFDLEEKRDQWQRLRTWFRPPDRVRVVTPLVLSYDSRRREFGFYRLVMPRLREMPRKNFPNRPLGLETVSWFLKHGRPESVREFRETWRVVEVKHDLSTEGEPPVHRVAIRFAQEVSGSEAALDLMVRVGDAGLEPLCRLPRSGEPITPMDAALQGRIQLCNEQTAATSSP